MKDQAVLFTVAFVVCGVLSFVVSQLAYSKGLNAGLKASRVHTRAWLEQFYLPASMTEKERNGSFVIREVAVRNFFGA